MRKPITILEYQEGTISDLYEIKHSRPTPPDKEKMREFGYKLSWESIDPCFSEFYESSAATQSTR